MMAKECTERLPAVAVLVHRPHYSARLMRFRSRGPSEFCSQIRYRNTLTEIAWKDAEKGNVYLSIREKQGIVFCRRCVLQTVTSPCVVLLVDTLRSDNSDVHENVAEK